MTTRSLQILALPLLAGALCFSACGKKSETTSEVEIPESPDKAMEFISKELAKANGAVLWQAMPASYQNDVNAIAQLAGTKIDAEIYDQMFSMVNRVGTVLDKQKEFVFNTSLGSEKPDEEQVAQMRAAWPSITELIDVITSSSVSSAARLQAFEGKAFFKDTISTVLSNVDALAKLQPENEAASLSDYKDIQVNYLEGTETEATLEVSIPGQEAETKNFVKVEDRWVPQDIAQTWTKQIAGARSKLEAIDPAQIAKQKPQIMSVFTMLDGVLTQIEAAETQQQFDQALQGAMMPIMGLMMIGQGMGSGAPAMPATPTMPPSSAMPPAPSTL